jgi:hypothetical protein
MGLARMATLGAQFRWRLFRRHGKGSTRTLLVLVALAVTMTVPASASAIGVPAGSLAAMQRLHYAAPDARSGTGSTMSAWLTGETAAVITLGVFALALWTASHRPDDSGFDGGDAWGRGDPGRPGPPKAPGGEDLHWSLFEAEFRDYARLHERRRELATRAE